MILLPGLLVTYLPHRHNFLVCFTHILQTGHQDKDKSNSWSEQKFQVKLELEIIEMIDRFTQYPVNSFYPCNYQLLVCIVMILISAAVVNAMKSLGILKMEASSLYD